MKTTPLIEAHRKLNGKLVDFGGWQLPVQYSGIAAEHQAVRTAAGLFDVSHMGEFEVTGPDAGSFLNYLVTNDVAKLVDGKALYTAMCLPSGGIVDDLIIYRKTENDYLVVVNAANIDKDFEWAQSVAQKFNVAVRNASSEYGQIAVQGPLAESILQTIAAENLSEIKTFFSRNISVAGHQVLAARTGYTGENGFELYSPANQTLAIWNAILEAGEDKGLLPCGLGARDTLRLEAALMLYGNDINETTNPLEAGLGWVVKWNKGDFSGRETLAAIQEAGVPRKLFGLAIDGKMIARSGYDVLDADGKTCGTVTSGTLSPTLGFPIALAYLPSNKSLGETVSIAIRNKTVTAEIVSTPFYRRKK